MDMQSKKLLNGYNLVELLVVMAIIGLLTTLAVPTYKNYLRRTKISGAMKILYAYNDAAWELYSADTIDAYGEFVPNLTQIGVDPANMHPSSPICTAFPATLSAYLAPYLEQFCFGNSIEYPPQCAISQITAYISNVDSSGYSTNGSAPYIHMIINTALNKQKVKKTFCGFYDFQLGYVPNTTTTIDDCYNLGDPNQASAFYALTNELFYSC